MLYVQKITEAAVLPSRCFRSAGYDLCSAYDYVIPAGRRQLCKTDLIMMVPEGTYGRIASRSGLASAHCVDVGADVIDDDYRGNVQILLCKNSKEDYVVKAGRKIAQLILEVSVTPEVCEIADKISPTGRGSRGFGSTGLANQDLSADLEQQDLELTRHVELSVRLRDCNEGMKARLQELVGVLNARDRELVEGETQMAGLLRQNTGMKRKVANLMVMIHDKDERLAEKTQEIARLEARLEAMEQGARGERNN